MPEINTLAYYENPYIMAVIGFIVQAPGLTHKHWPVGDKRSNLFGPFVRYEEFFVKMAPCSLKVVEALK